MQTEWTKALAPLLLALFALTSSGSASNDDVNPAALLDLLSEHRDLLRSPFVENDLLCHCSDDGCDDELIRILGSAGRGMCRAEGGVCKTIMSLVVMKDGEPPREKSDMECVLPKDLQPPGHPFTCYASSKQDDRVQVHCCRSRHFCNDNITLSLKPLDGPYDDYGPELPRVQRSIGMTHIIILVVILLVILAIIGGSCAIAWPHTKDGFVCCGQAFVRLFRNIKAKVTSFKEKNVKAEKTGIVKLEDGVVADPAELEHLKENKEEPPVREVDDSFPFLSGEFDSKLSGASLADAFYDLQHDLERKFADRSQITAELENQINQAKGPNHKPNHLLKLLDDLDSAPSTYTPSADTSGAASCKSSGVPVNLQRSFAQQIEVKRDQYLGGGRFGRVYKGYWRGDYFAIKTMDTKDHFSWARETEIYNTNMLRHNNLLRFIASYSHDAGYYMENWIITEFHEKGDLSDYLALNSVSRDVGLRMIRGVASGLSYLHLPIIGHCVEGKPAIAHRDLKSKNVLVKNDLTVCIADLGLSVKYDAINNCIDGDTQRKCGTPRYLSPELLDDSINLANFDAFCLSDIYALSLICWEVMNRMEDSHDPPRYRAPQYEIPYYEHVPREPTQDDLRSVVCDKGLRPKLNPAWASDPLLEPLIDTVKFMWSPRPINRPTAERVRIKVDEVIEAEEKAKALRSKVDESVEVKDKRPLLPPNNLTC